MPETSTTEVAVKVEASDTHKFMSFIRTTGKDEQGREVAPNGIKWVIR